ncbi:DtxR family transcriptional regulator [bacterium]|nr:DtxR family transcriptional regulator [bacterium]
MADKHVSLSRSMEDYLEAIYNLKIKNQVARIKDIAHLMEVKMPSATEAIRSLVTKGFVKHEPYENVELTDQGLDIARDIASRHSAVKDFLVGVLGLNDNDAEKEACGIEHAIRPDTLTRFLKLAEFVRACDDNHSLRLAHFQHYMKHGTYPDDCDFFHTMGSRHGHRHWHTRHSGAATLSDLEPGSKGRIVFVHGHGPIRRRLMEMGVTSGADFEVIRMAPMGDPIEIRIRGYNLSLRKCEAEHIEVEL